MQTQTTYRKQTAAAILKTARIETMRAGNAEIVVNLRGHNAPVIAMLGTRPDGFGGSVKDVLVLTDVDGLICRILTSPRSLKQLALLSAQCAVADFARWRWRSNRRIDHSK